MSLPTYDKTKRKKTYQALPKAAYVIKIKAAKEEQNRSGNGSHLRIAFDIAEGEYRAYYQNQFNGSSSEDKKWPNDAIFRMTVPTDSSESWVWDTWNSFFADLEDSNNGFVFNGDPKTLKDKLIGAKMHIEQSEYQGRIYNHTRMKWTCVAADVRNNKAGALPQDKLIATTSVKPSTDSDGFMNIPDEVDEEVPF